MQRALVTCLLLAAGAAVAPATARQAIDLSSATGKDAAAIAADYQVMRDVRYGPDDRQMMDLHLSKDVSRLGSRNFTIVFLHGGGFSFGSRSDNTRYITPFLQKGLNVVNMSYRIGQGVAIATEDLTLALNHLAGSAEAQRLRLDRVIVGGFSAGGQIASTVGLARHNPAYPFRLAADIRIAGILNFSGPVDGLEVVEKVFLDYPTEDFKLIGRNLYPPGGRFTRDEMLRLFTPITYFDDTAPPYFLSHGGRDDQIPPSTFERFKARLSTSRVRHHVAFYPEAGHSKNAADLRETFVALFRFLDALPH